MANLLTTDILARWTQNDPAEVAVDPLALEIIEKVSDLVCFLGGHDGTKTDADGVIIPEWDLTPGPTMAPIDVQMVALQVIKRSYENPTQIRTEGAIGPLGGDHHVDAWALFLDFTDAERATLTKHNIDGDPTPTDGGEVFVMATTRGTETMMPQTSPLYVGDDQQINLSTSLDPREWMIPLFNPGDPGDDSLYG